MITADHKSQSVNCWQDCANNVYVMKCGGTISPRKLKNKFANGVFYTTFFIEKKTKQMQSVGKVIATVFFLDRKRVLLIGFLDPGTTINSDWFCDSCINYGGPFKIAWEKLTKGVMFHHVNAPTDYHLFRKTEESLERNETQDERRSERKNDEIL